MPTSTNRLTKITIATVTVLIVVGGLVFFYQRNSYQNGVSYSENQKISDESITTSVENKYPSDQKNESINTPNQDTTQNNVESSSDFNKSMDNRCIITVSGQRYDVTEFRNLHKGGNIFKCGDDMTSTFFSAHKSKTLKKLEKYKID